MRRLLAWILGNPVRIAASATGLVVLAAMAISYDALAELGRAAGILPALSWIYPLLIDGILIVGVVAAVTLRQARMRVRVYAWSMISGATAISVVGNGTHALAHGGVLLLPWWGAVLASAVPAASLASALHLLVVIVRHARRPLPQVTRNMAADAAPTLPDVVAPPAPRPQPKRPPRRPARPVDKERAILKHLEANRDRFDDPAERAAVIKEAQEKSGASIQHARRVARNWRSARPHLIAAEEA